MSADPPPPGRPRLPRLSRDHLIDLTPLKASPAFARMWIGSTLAGLGGQLTIVAIMLHMFELTGDTFAVSMIAVAGLVPMVIAGLWGGMLADAFDRRRVALIAATVTFASTLLLAILAWNAWETVWWLYVLSVVNSSANSIVMAARQSIVPRLLPRELLPAASALQGITVGIMVMAGPALAGVLVAFTGYAWTYTLDVALMSAMFLGLLTLPAIRPEGAVVRPGLQSLRDGIRFLRRAGNIRLQFLLDIIAMTFGQPLSLLPAIGAVLLGGGPITTGVLTASVAVGAFVSSVFSGPVGRIRRQGLGIERAIQVYGAAIAAFGLVLLGAAFGLFAPATVDEHTPNLALIAAAAVCLAVSGAADNVSSIFRNTMVQAAVPDAVRGRLQGIFIVVVAGGPRVGALYAGTLATFAALWFPPLLGGLVIIGLVGLLVRLNPRFRHYDALHPEP
ncbi:putative MFS family arabinose efflux permease [Microbacterium telephonicum]|uniref:Putative MFS family arabinose efflux permease n=1 Tax=Microbacterium telephonicum TaxID=1714841 RepID=A0A498C2T5_9MICO|nr:putative MFS family arabinose efflux permease [Microbacterium telephonicum]